MGQYRFLRVVKLLALLVVASFLGACTSSGVVPKDMNLAISNVAVSQAQSMSESERFLHELREEIRVEFSRARAGNKKARLTLELRELAFEGVNFLGGVSNKSRMESFGRLEYASSGEQIGEFSVKVSVPNKDADMGSAQGRAAIRATLLKKMAAATLAKVYGSSRADNISSNFAQYTREPYRVRVAGPISLIRNPANFVVDFPVAPEEVKSPVIIEAPQLPVDAPQVVEDTPPAAKEVPPVIEVAPAVTDEAPVVPSE